MGNDVPIAMAADPHDLRLPYFLNLFLPYCIVAQVCSQTGTRIIPPPAIKFLSIPIEVVPVDLERRGHHGKRHSERRQDIVAVGSSQIDAPSFPFSHREEYAPY